MGPLLFEIACRTCLLANAPWSTRILVRLRPPWKPFKGYTVLKIIGEVHIERAEKVLDGMASVLGGEVGQDWDELGGTIRRDLADDYRVLSEHGAVGGVKWASINPVTFLLRKEVPVAVVTETELGVAAAGAPIGVDSGRTLRALQTGDGVDVVHTPNQISVTVDTPGARGLVDERVHEFFFGHQEEERLRSHIVTSSKAGRRLFGRMSSIMRSMAGKRYRSPKRPFIVEQPLARLRKWGSMILEAYKTGVEDMRQQISGD